MLAADGTIHRMGTGSESNTERDLFIGKVSERLFDELRQLITPELLQWLGQFADPQPQGRRCQLTIGFRQHDKVELTSHWEYGTDSQGPPEEVGDFVRAALATTSPWYEEQKQLGSR